MKNFISWVIFVCFTFTGVVGPYQSHAQELLRLPVPGVMVHLSPGFTPAHLQGLTIHPDNALHFDFLIHKGDNQLDNDQKKEEYTKLVKYFLASLTIPDEDQWVNLSPYEHNRIIKDDFGKTEMGRDLLSQDYLLKQITSSLMYPEEGLGRKFWDKVYERAWKEYGTTNVPVNTFNKVWIIPDEAAVYESGNTVYILRNHLKVMLEEDYLSLQKHSAMGDRPNTSPITHSLASQIIKAIILPELEREVNEGKNFAMLRQIYSGMILATWYKHVLKESLLGKVYANKARVSGVDQKDPQVNEAIYQRYLKAFKKGVFNYIKEDADKYSQQVIPRRYFAGGLRGFDGAMTGVVAEEGFRDAAVVVLDTGSKIPASMRSEIDFASIVQNGSDIDNATVALGANRDVAMNDRAQQIRDGAMLSRRKLLIGASVAGTLANSLGGVLRAQQARPSPSAPNNTALDHMNVINNYIRGLGMPWLQNRLFDPNKNADDILKNEMDYVKDPRLQGVFRDYYMRLLIAVPAWINQHGEKAYTGQVLQKIAEDTAGQYKRTPAPSRILVLDDFFKGIWSNFIEANVNNGKNKETVNVNVLQAANFVDKRLEGIVREMINAFAELNVSPYGKGLQGNALQAELKRLEDQRVETEKRVNALVQQFNENYLLPNGRLITFRYNNDSFEHTYSVQAYKIKDSRDVRVLGDPVRVVRAERVDLTGIQAEFSGLSFQGRGLILIDLKRAHDSAWAIYNAVRSDKLLSAKAKEWFDNNYKGAGVMANIIKTMERLILAHELGHQLQHKLGVFLNSDNTILKGDHREDSELVARIAEGLVNPKFALTTHLVDVLPEVRQELALQERMRQDEEKDAKEEARKGKKGGPRIYAVPFSLLGRYIDRINLWLKGPLFGNDWERDIDNAFDPNVSDGQITEALKNILSARFTNGGKFADEFDNVLRQIDKAMVQNVLKSDSAMTVNELVELENHYAMQLIPEAKTSNDLKELFDRWKTIFSPERFSNNEELLRQARKSYGILQKATDKLNDELGFSPIDWIRWKMKWSSGWKARTKGRLTTVKFETSAFSNDPNFKKKKPSGQQRQPEIFRLPKRRYLPKDRAMKGGIDLNSSNLNLQIKRDGRGVPLPLLQQDWVQLSQIQGFIPTITEIRPAIDIPLLRELQQKLRASSGII